MSDWQPIATAPWDGTWILAFVQDVIPPYEITCWFNYDGEQGWVTDSNTGPTHWQALPDPPSLAAVARTEGIDTGPQRALDNGFCEAHQPPHTTCACCEAVHVDDERKAAVARLRALRDQWAAEGARIDTFHATMGIGFKFCADELGAALDALLIAARPQPIDENDA